MAVDWLRHSCTYREILKEGFFRGFAEGYAKSFARLFPEELFDVQLECHRGWLEYLGREWLGLPPSEIRARIEAIADVSELEDLIRKLTDERLKISTWEQLLASSGFPSTRRTPIR